MNLVWLEQSVPLFLVVMVEQLVLRLVCLFAV